MIQHRKAEFQLGHVSNWRMRKPEIAKLRNSSAKNMPFYVDRYGDSLLSCILIGNIHHYYYQQRLAVYGFSDIAITCIIT